MNYRKDSKLTYWPTSYETLKSFRFGINRHNCRKYFYIEYKTDSYA